MKRILLTRDPAKSSVDQAFFASFGYEAVTVSLSELRLRTLSEAELRLLQSSDWVFFTSSTPIPLILPNLAEGTKLAALGQKTAASLAKVGRQADFIAQTETKAGLLAEWTAKFSPSAQIFYPKSNLAADIELPGFELANVVCYDNILPPSSSVKIAELLQRRALQAVYLTSPSAWQRFKPLYQKNYYPLELIAIGPTTANSVKFDNFPVVLKSDFGVKK